MKNILLVSHYTKTPGPIDKLASYLKRHSYSLFFILNPLYPKSSLKSVIKSNTQEIKYKLFWPIQYFFEGLSALIKFNKFKSNFDKPLEFDLAICFDPLSFINIYLFKKSYRIKKLIYYNVDFSTKRFKNKFINFLYLFLNRFAYKNCDSFFYLTENFIKNIDPINKYSAEAFLLKHTVNISGINKVAKKLPNSIIFAGSLSYSVDFTDLIKALELIKKDGINFTFDIYGGGHQKEYLEDLICKSIIKNNVNFKGIVSNEILLKEILPKYILGVCPYITKGNNYVPNHMFQGSDLSTKIIEYIASGLPVITTRLYKAFDTIERNKFGFLVKNETEWHDAVYNLLTNDILYKEYSKNALGYAKNYDEEKILTPVFNKIMD